MLEQETSTIFRNNQQWSLKNAFSFLTNKFNFRRTQDYDQLLHLPQDNTNNFLSKNTVPVSNSSMSLCTDNAIDIFLELLGNPLIKSFLEKDCCCQLADKYLLSIVFIYFVRAGFKTEEYTPYNFFVALHLAHDMEEDDEDQKLDLYAWALGRKWFDYYPRFLSSRDDLWKRLQYYAMVSPRCCQKAMSLKPMHPIWERNRGEVHAGANRAYNHSTMKGASEMTGKCGNCWKLKAEIELQDNNNKKEFTFTTIEDTADNETKTKCAPYQASPFTERHFHAMTVVTSNDFLMAKEK